MRAHRLLVTAALLSVLAATSVLASPAFGTAVGDAGLRRALEHQPADRTVLDMRSDVTAGTWARTGETVRAAARGAFGGLPVTVAAGVHSGP